MIDLSLVLPVHNEEDIIEKVTDEVIIALNKLKIRYEVILVENGSSDNSLAVIKKLSKNNKAVKWLVAEKGYGSAVIAGLNSAKGKFLGYMPSDGQVDLKILSKLWNSTKKNQFDLLKVKRVTRENLSRSIVSYSFSTIIFLLFGTRYIDVNGSPRIFKKEYFDILSLRSKDSFIDAELLIKASKLKWKIKELPMENIDRYGGKSTRSLKTFMEFFKNIFNYRTNGYINSWKQELVS